MPHRVSPGPARGGMAPGLPPRPEEGPTGGIEIAPAVFYNFIVRLYILFGIFTKYRR